ncbi:MAG: OB-fold domain-containing protein [Deltaproteobacteria bacterium]|nr:OB-fold domain-containing protein [Deltaproteobacteria bacterium]
MIGITSYGGYIPRLRLDRMSIFQSMGWFAPAIVMVAQGERSFCNWDEDSLTMAVAAARDCLIGKDKSKVDGVFLCSTTLPFVDRLNAGILKTALNLKDELEAADFTSSERAGTTGLIQALSSIRGGDKKQVLVTATDKRLTKAAYFYEMWFGDGAASLLVGDTDVIAEFMGDYMWEERWVRDNGYSKIIPQAVNGLFQKLSISMDDVDRFVFPCFFKAEHRKIASKLGCDAMYFKVTDAILDLAQRKGIKGSIANKKTTDNYLKFLKFRGLIQTEMGIRAEAPTQTAMTVLWRKRDMLLGMVGGKCTKCGTPQFPRSAMCVNPECEEVNSQEPYEFAGIPAKVKTFTGDMLAVSVDPPHIYGMVQFEGGGRLMADFSDCELSEVSVGQPVEMNFRRRLVDEQRGFSGYFWKAVPIPGEKPAAGAAEACRGCSRRDPV